MATVKRFEELEIWILARELAEEIHKTYVSTEVFSRDYKLRDQINRSSGSIMDNIAEEVSKEMAEKNLLISYQ